ncbi:MAG: hypothetical protein BGP14_04000 [Sphingobacteriales bacterium 44-15]|nr:MAG: hypothetical protein BGP14_04000 [Sphingobacteriales bacterium 44-15]
MVAQYHTYNMNGCFIKQYQEKKQEQPGAPEKWVAALKAPVPGVMSNVKRQASLTFHKKIRKIIVDIALRRQTHNIIPEHYNNYHNENKSDSSV